MVENNKQHWIDLAVMELENDGEFVDQLRHCRKDSERLDKVNAQLIHLRNVEGSPSAVDFAELVLSELHSSEVDNSLTGDDDTTTHYQQPEAPAPKATTNDCGDAMLQVEALLASIGDVIDRIDCELQPKINATPQPHAANYQIYSCGDFGAIVRKCA